jgi:hypothetical protein
MNNSIRRLFFYSVEGKPRVKPSIASIPQELWFLIGVLCLLSVELGVYLGHSSRKTVGGDLLNLAIGGMLLINTLAFQFQWSRKMSTRLRAGSYVISTLAILLFVWSWL